MSKKTLIKSYPNIPMPNMNGMNNMGNMGTMGSLGYMKYMPPMAWNRFGKSTLQNPIGTTKSTLANYNDPAEINSIRDIVLGSFNPNMKHSKLLGVDWSKLPIINVLPNSVQYFKDFVLEPITQGKPNHLVLNQLTNLGEIFDSYMGPIKATIQTTFNGGTIEDVGKAIKQSTIGDEQGIHNFDYDTGNMAADLALEIITDPLTWVSFGGAGLVKGSAKAALRSVSGFKSLTKATQKVLKRLEVNVAEEVITDAILRASRNYGKVIYNNKTHMQDFLKKNITNELVKTGNEAFINELSKNVARRTNTSQVALNTLLNKALNKTVEDTTSAVYRAMSKNILSTMGLKGVQIDNIISGSLLKIGGFPSGITPFYMLVLKKNSPFRTAMSNIVLRKASKEYLSEGESNVVEAIAKEQRINKRFTTPSDNMTHESLYYFTSALETAILEIKKVLAAKETSAYAKQRAIMKILNKSSNEYFETIEDFIEYLNRFDDIAKNALGEELADTGLTFYIDNFKEYAKYINDAIKADDIKRDLSTNRHLYTLTEDIILFLKKVKNNVRDIKQLVTHAKYESAIRFIMSNKFYNNLEFLAQRIIKVTNDIIANKTNLSNLLGTSLYSDTLNLLRKYEKYFGEFINDEDILVFSEYFKILADLFEARRLEDFVLEFKNFIELLKDVQNNKIKFSNRTNYKIPEELEEVFFKTDLVNEDMDFIGFNEKLYTAIMNTDSADLARNRDNLTQTGLYKIASDVQGTYELNQKFLKHYEATQEAVLEDTFERINLNESTKILEVLKDYSLKYNDPEVVLSYDIDKLTEMFDKSRVNKIIKHVENLKNYAIETGYATEYNEILFNNFIEDFVNFTKTLTDYQRAIVHKDVEKQQFLAINLFERQEIVKKSLQNLISFLDTKSALRLERQGIGHDFEQVRGLGDWLGERFENFIGANAIKNIEVNVTFKGIKRKVNLDVNIINPTVIVRDKATGTLLENEGAYNLNHIKQIKEAYIKAIKETYKDIIKEDDIIEFTVSDYLKIIGYEESYKYNVKAFKSKQQLLDPDNAPLKIKMLKRITGVMPENIALEFKPNNPNIIIKFKSGKQTYTYELSEFDFKELFTPKYIRTKEGYKASEHSTNITIEDQKVALDANSKKILNARDVLKEVEDSLDMIHIDSFNNAYLQNITGNKIHFLQIEHAVQNALIESSPFFQKLLVNGAFQISASQLKNMKVNSFVRELGQVFTEDDKTVIALFAQYIQGVQNKYWLRKRIRRLIKDSKYKFPKNFEAACFTTIENLSALDLGTTNKTLDDIIITVLNQLGININTSDLAFKKVDVDTLLRETGITEADVLSAMREAGLDITSGRHSAAYDTFAQHLAYERKTGQDYYGYTWDIETTGTIDKNGIPNGEITEITLIRRISPDKFEVVFNKKLQASEEDIINLYNTNGAVLDSLGITREIYLNKYVNKTESYTPEMLVADFLDVLRTLPSRSQLMGHNSNMFDLIYLERKAVANPNNIRMTSRDKRRFIKGQMTRQEYMHRFRNIHELIDNLDILDSRELLTVKDLQISGGGLYAFRDILRNYLEQQRKLMKFTEYSKVPVKGLTNLNDAFLSSLLDAVMSNMRKVSNIETDSLAEWAAYSNPDKLLDMLFTITPNKQKIDKGIIKESISKDNLELVITFIEDLKSTFSDIGKLNRHLRAYPIPHELFHHDPTKGFDKKLYESFIKKLAEVLGEPRAKELLDSEITNLSQVLSAISEGIPFYAYKSINPAIFKIFNWEYLGKEIKGMNPILKSSRNILLAEDFFRNVMKTVDQLQNTDLITKYAPQFKEIIDMIHNTPIITEGYFVKYDPKDPKMTLAQIEAYIRRLTVRRYIGKDSKVRATELLEKIKNKFPDFYEHLIAKTFKSTVSMNRNYNNYYPAELIKESKTAEYNNLSKLKSVQDNVISKYKRARAKINVDSKVHTKQNNSFNIYNAMVNLYESTFKEDYATAKTKYFDRTSRQFTQVLNAKYINNILRCDPIDLRNEIIANTTNFKLKIYKTDNRYFNNADAFGAFLENKESYKEIGLNIKYDVETESIEITLDKALAKRIKVNKNKYQNFAKYVLDGKPVIAPIFQELTEKEFYKFIKGNIKWKRAMWNVRQSCIEINSELSGRLGLPNYADYFKVVDEGNKTSEYSMKRMLGISDPSLDLPYFFSDVVGNLKEVMSTAGAFNSSFFEMSGHLLNKMWNHTHKYYEYINWFKESGMRLDGKEFSRLNNAEIRRLLIENKDYVLVFLKPNSKAIGGVELVKINSYADSTLDLAKSAGATVVPYDFYCSAARNINIFTYGSKALAYWNHYLTFLKKTWLFDPGVIIRNVMDTAMRTLAEGGSIPDTVRSYVQSFDLLNRYDRVNEEIRKMSPIGRFTLENMNKYFELFTDVLDKDTYKLIHDFLDDSGINTLDILVDGIFGKGMKLNNWIERTSRFAMYLNLINKGTDYSEAIRRISETYFNYDVQSYGDFLMKSFIPFWTYVSRNIDYMVHLIEENPAFLRTYINGYTALWDFDSLNHEELEDNISLQYQILNGNVPLKLFGYEDQEVTKIVNTKYGPQEVLTTNTAVLKMGSSILDGLSTLIDPVHSISNKLAPPIQTAIDSIIDFKNVSLGNLTDNKINTYQENENYFKENFGSNSVQVMFNDPIKFVKEVPIVGRFVQRLTHTDENGNVKWGSTTQERTNNNIISALSVAGVLGATSRWGDFKNKYTGRNYYYPSKNYTRSGRSYIRRYYSKGIKVATPRPGQSITYRLSTNGRTLYPYYSSYVPRTYTSGKRPWSKYENFIYKTKYPNYAHHNPSRAFNSNKLNIPQYLYSYMGKNKQGKSKIMSWMDMNTRFKVKSTLRRLASP